MPKVLVSNNSELLRHFTALPFKRLALQLLVAATGAEARSLFAKEEPALVVLDADDPDGFEVAKEIKHEEPGDPRDPGRRQAAVRATRCDRYLRAGATSC